MLPSTQRSDCLCAHNAHLSVRRLGENIYGLYCSLFIIFNKFHWGKRKAGKFFPLGLCSFLCSTNPARDRESCFTRLMAHRLPCKCTCLSLSMVFSCSLPGVIRKLEFDFGYGPGVDSLLFDCLIWDQCRSNAAEELWNMTFDTTICA